MSIKISFSKPAPKISFAKPKKKPIIVIAPVFKKPKPKGFTFVFDPKLSNDLGCWWAADKGSDGEPLPLKEGEIAVVKLWYMEEDGWKFVLSNGKKMVRQKLVGLGFCDNLRDAVVFMLPNPEVPGADKQYRNAVPKAMREAAYRAHIRFVRELASRDARNF